MNILAMMAERYGSQTGSRIDGGQDAPGPRGSSRRVRMDDLEEMMMLEAIRMSLASEEDRRKKEEEESRGSKKDARKDAKKKGKELKKAEKAAKKSGIYPGSLSQSSINLRGESSEAAGKGKAVQQPEADLSPQTSVTSSPVSNISPFTTNTISDDPQLHLERARAHLQP